MKQLDRVTIYGLLAIAGVAVLWALTQLDHGLGAGGAAGGGAILMQSLN